ncbi:uncharacterized protein IUM83_18735 [Phytophthora cinnamomi]|uniref:uncharacterized protein n=1 Tax=Phytophthora cinnamomi TaxID=4785 RepID=UPI00355AB964|nr:hypothetical protein IUM83_18735 [Phytophthora cinnamomi]
MTDSSQVDGELADWGEGDATKLVDEADTSPLHVKDAEDRPLDVGVRGETDSTEAGAMMVFGTNLDLVALEAKLGLVTFEVELDSVVLEALEAKLG